MGESWVSLHIDTEFVVNNITGWGRLPIRVLRGGYLHVIGLYTQDYNPCGRLEVEDGGRVVFERSVQCKELSMAGGTLESLQVDGGVIIVEEYAEFKSSSGIVLKGHVGLGGRALLEMTDNSQLQLHGESTSLVG